LSDKTHHLIQRHLLLKKAEIYRKPQELVTSIFIN
jgi:hypothetical protein